MFTNEKQLSYGLLMPVQVYNLHWACGCAAENVKCASFAPIGDNVEMLGDCPRCYKGPYGNVWD